MQYYADLRRYRFFPSEGANPAARCVRHGKVGCTVCGVRHSVKRTAAHPQHFVKSKSRLQKGVKASGSLSLVGHKVKTHDP